MKGQVIYLLTWSSNGRNRQA